MRIRHTSRAVVLVLALAFGLLPASTGVTARGSSPVGTVVARGLVNPRGIAVADDGALYVAEAGTAGTEELPLPTGSPPNARPGRRGATGQVLRIAPGGATTVIAAGLPSFSVFGSTGPAGLVVAGGTLWLANGGAGPVTAVPGYTPLPHEAAVLRIDARTGAITQLADLGAHERAHNPDGFGVESNPFGLARGADGALYVADAGGNALYRVEASTGDLRLVTVFAGLPVPQPNPARGGRNEVDPAPTGVAAGTDGSLYVGLLPGGRTTTGGAKVVRVAADGAVSDAATGLTAVIAVAVGPDGRLYVAELITDIDRAQQPAVSLPGRVLRVAPDGTKQVVADGLRFPQGLAFDPAGNLYVVINANSPTGPPPSAVTPPQGQVLRFDGVAPAAAPGLPSTGGGHAAEHSAAVPALVLALLAGCALGGDRFLRRRARRA